MGKRMFDAGALVEPLSRELSAYAYRMVGGYQDAEDALHWVAGREAIAATMQSDHDGHATARVL